ncbi:MAG: 2-C-methyl-D-erythritol 4-phosphate cytidylyltransferase [Lachnospiraceae bacterium]|nr:2-C-methyl-D-erythritol 4-phosphate cytidylyltransferase [Lachnospiraceae bacterium]
MNIALCLSGGIGTRLGGDTPKQYIRVGRQMVITYCLETLLCSKWIDIVIVVAAEKWRAEILEDVGAKRQRNDQWVYEGKVICFADPGENRQLSILNGMEKAVSLNLLSTEQDFQTVGMKSDMTDRNDANTVFVHDAARPMLTESQIDACFRALPGHDGVMPVLPMKDTVYYSEDGKGISQLLKREKIFAGQAPELFLLEKYLEATKTLLPDRIMEIKGSGEPAVMHGMDIVMIPGDEGNFKITTAADLIRFREFIEKAVTEDG